MSERRELFLIFIVTLAAWGMTRSSVAQESSARPSASATTKSIPVILDTDTGNDVDDTWALALLLKNPRFDVKLITTTDGQAEFRARLIAKMLTLAGRSDIPIALGAGRRAGGEGKLAPWVKDFPLSQFGGTVHRDGVGALIDTVHRSPEPVTIIAIGPLQTLSAALKRDPKIAPRCNLVGMQGSVFRGYRGSKTPQPEFNVKLDPQGAKRVLAAPWRSLVITPLDTCGLPEVTLSGPCLEALRQSDDKIVKGVLECAQLYTGKSVDAPLESTSVLFDTVAIYLADAGHHPLLNLQRLNIAVTDQGLTIVSPRGKAMEVATSWKDVQAYRDYLVGALLAGR